jgi:hypothetical protein
MKWIFHSALLSMNRSQRTEKHWLKCDDRNGEVFHWFLSCVSFFGPSVYNEKWSAQKTLQNELISDRLKNTSVNRGRKLAESPIYIYIWVHPLEIFSDHFSKVHAEQK